MTAIKQITIAVVATLAATAISFGQTFSNLPNDTIKMTGTWEDLETLSIQQLNLTGDTLQLKWEKVSETVPAAWEASVCDNSICYTSLVSSGKMNPIVPGDYGLLLLHITPHLNYGTAVIRYAVWDTTNPSLKDTLTYILTVNDPSGLYEEIYGDAFKIFPNPVKEYINFTSATPAGFRFLIYDLSGKEIQRGSSMTNTYSFSTNSIPGGTYCISIFENNTTVCNKKFIIQK